MTTNDQPSPTHPTQTPHSEPESSTGPDQLGWDERAGGYYLTAKVSHGSYAAYFGDAFENPHRWHAVYWREEQSIYNPAVTTCHLYRGDDLDEALAAAQQHHKAALRRLAWEQYMRDNDPPNRPIDILLTQCDKATVEANIAGRALGLW